MRATATLFFAVACAGNIARAEEWTDSGITGEILRLVRLHSAGKEECTKNEDEFTIAFDAMRYHVHVPNRVGRMQKWQEELGPRMRGVVIMFRALHGAYEGPMVLPQTLRGPYYATHCNELEEAERHLFVRARFGSAFPADLKRRILKRLGFAFPEERAAIPVRVRAHVDEALRLRVTLANGLNKPIRFTTFGTKPSESNGETLNVSLVDVYRNGEKRNLYLARPDLRIAPAISGPASLPIPPGKSLTVLLDLRKWTIAGGWIQGEYELVLRMENIVVDDRVTLSVLSDPVRVVVE